MPYPKPNEAILAKLLTVLDRPEIAAEINARGLRRSVIERGTLNAADRIWQSVSSRAEALSLAEQTIERIEKRHGYDRGLTKLTGSFEPSGPSGGLSLFVS